MFNIRQFALKMSQITGYVAYWIYKTAVPQIIFLLHYGDTFTQKTALKRGEMIDLSTTSLLTMHMSLKL